MSRRLSPRARLLLLCLLLALAADWAFAAGTAWDSAASAGAKLPSELQNYAPSGAGSLWAALKARVEQEPFNLWAALFFFTAVVHTFFTHKFRHLAHLIQERHRRKLILNQSPSDDRARDAELDRPSALARMLHFLGEVEVVFGIWAVPLLLTMGARLGWSATNEYVNHKVGYHEALFVVVIMIIASTRPVLRLAESCLDFFARLAGGGTIAWWTAILVVGPLLGSLITEPAAMTICASLLADKFYELSPSRKLAYATLGLLFVNISVGGVLTNFAAPPVLMVARQWHWDTFFMLGHFGWVAVAGMVVATLCYLSVFRSELTRLRPEIRRPDPTRDHIPLWVTAGHIAAMAWSVWQADDPVLLLGGFLFFLAFSEVSEEYQDTLNIRPAVLVGFFLAGLVIHGGLQEWWISPLLNRLPSLALMLGAVGLTAFNDNAAITYLASLVPGLTTAGKYAVMSGAVTGGGLTVIANSPNPAGQSILGKYFPDGVSPLALLAGALPATIILGLAFLLLGRLQF